MNTRFRSALLALALALTLSIASIAALAATTADRSPFTQGHWWDPTRSGHGFEIFNAGGQVALVWYTYDDLGNPVWYYAQGGVADLGTATFDLLRTRWSEGRVSSSTKVGTVKLTVRHPEAIELAYAIGAASGTWSIKPFVASGVASEVDHSGHWFDPAHSGWGFTLTEQNDVLGAVFYFYDAAGEPTWRSGFGRAAAQRKVDLYSTWGYCPYCTPTGIRTQAAGSVTFDYRNEASLTLSSAMNAPLAPGLRIDGANAVQLGRPASARPADRQLAAFDKDSSLLSYLREGMTNLRTGFASTSTGSDFSAGTPGAPLAMFSGTNLQEADVDEGDVLKSDGRYVYAFVHNDYGGRMPRVRVVEVAADGSMATPRASFDLAAASTPSPPAAGSATAGAGLLRYAERLVAITGTQARVTATWPFAALAGWQNGITNLEVFDASTPATPVSRWKASFDGYLVATRRIGDRLYLVLRYVPATNPNFSSGPVSREVAAGLPLETLLPKARLDGSGPTEAVPRTAFYAPPQGSLPPTADMTIVHEIDLATPRVAASLAVVGGVETIYVSPTALYIATTRSAIRTHFATLDPSTAGATVTDIHQVTLANGLRAGATGTVEGFLSADASLAQFRLSERQGRLRVVTSTIDDYWWGPDNRNRLTVLEPSGVNPGALKTVAILPNAQRPQPLGLPGETLYATRFLDDRLYAVTFGVKGGIRIDPLYTVDLSVATDPRIRGQLVVPGFSTYLHPVAGGYLVGFGRNITTDGIDQGLKVSLFDVRDDTQPREVGTVMLGGPTSSSALENDHHAFSALLGTDGAGTFALPARLVGASPAGRTNAWDKSGLMRFELRRSGSSLVLDDAPDLITASRTSSPWLAGSGSSPDPATTNARSILFANGTLYAADGWFWLRDPAGNTTGPF